MADRIQATPQNPALGAVARALRRAQEFAGQYQVLPQVPLLGGMGIDELLSLPGAASLMEDISYNGPRAVIRGGNVATGGLGTFKLDPRVADVADVAMTVSPLAAVAGRTAGRGAMALGRAGERLAERVVPPIMERGGLGAQALEALAAGSRSQVIKPKGGNWLTGSIERQIEPLKQPLYPGRMPFGHNEQEIAAALNVTPEEILENADPSSIALNRWIDQKLAKYIRNEMGTPEDPLRALAERDVLHFEPQQIFGYAPSQLMRKRAGAGMPTPLFGKSEMARRWETLADRAIDPYPAGSYKHGSLDEDFLVSNPWLEKVPDETLVYSAKGLQRDMGFDHLVDELRNATRAGTDLPPELRLRPDQLSKVSMPQAVELVDRINKWRAAQKAEADLARSTNAATVEYKAYPTVPGTEAPNERGLRWVELRQPEGGAALTDDALRRAMRERDMTPDEIEAVLRNPEMRAHVAEEALGAGEVGALADALKYEGEVMGHCVGGYCPDVMEGRSRIFSLRDKKGEPHVTIEVAPNQQPYPVSGEAFTKLDPQTRAQYRQYVMEWRRRNPDIEELTDEHVSQALREAGVPPAPPEITQIKGKANRAPKEDYLPFVQDFVKSQQWGRVGDAQNAGMRKFTDVFSSNELRMLQEAGAELPSSGWLTGEDIQRLHNMIVPEGRRLKYDARGNVVGSEEQGYAAGGAVVAGPRSYDPQAVERLAAQLIEDTYA